MAGRSLTYNFFAGTLICRGYHDHFPGPLTMVVDQRSKETHDKLKFDSYLHTRLVGDCEYAGQLAIQHMESHDVLGLQAVDMISWGLFRYYEHDDQRFIKIIAPHVGQKENWYTGK